MMLLRAVSVLALNVAAAAASPLASVENSFTDFDVGSIMKAQTSGASVKLAASESIKSLNWAGASKSGTNVTSVTTTVTVPGFQYDPDGWTTGMAIFAAIDGYFTCPVELLAAGIILAAQGGPDTQTFTAFWRWLPNDGGSNNQVDFPIKTGHKIRLSLDVLSPTSAKGTVENLSTGQTDFRILGSDKPLCAADASWVVARYQSMGDWMRWVNFTDPVTMTDASATTAAGETLNLEGADLLDIQDPKLGALTSCKINSPSSLTCEHA